MHLSPDEIQRRTFAIEDRGYDRDEVRVFLLEVASALRLALHTTRPPAATAPEGAPAGAAPPAGAPTDADSFARLGAEVADVLRAAHDAVTAMHAQADTEIAARHEEALADADEVRRQAETDASWTHDRAKRVLITAQEQSDAIVAEAETNAAELLATARRQAREHADQVATRTRRHAEQILRAEREALRRLHQAQAGVAAAVEMLTGSETRPVVDLTELRPNVRLGSLSIEVEPEPEPAAESAPTTNDPVARMIRNAVDRAAQHAQESAAAAPDDPEPTTGAPTDEGRPAEATGAEPGSERSSETARTAARVAAGRAPTTATGALFSDPGPIAPAAPIRPADPHGPEPAGPTSHTTSAGAASAGGSGPLGGIGPPPTGSADEPGPGPLA